MRNSDIFLRDPFVLPWEGKYYLYGTRSETAFAKKADGFDVYVGTDLENWEGPIEVFHRSADFWATRYFWAPEVHVWDGKFYMFATFSDNKNKQGTAILRSDSPLGPFKPWSDGTVTPENWRCLDGTFYVAQNGVPYMVFCHEWKEVKDGTICAVKLSDDLKKAIGVPRVLFHASLGKPAVRSFIFGNYVTDGPFFFRTEDGRLHMLWSSFGQNHKYVQALAYSSNDDIDGVWTVRKELLFDKDGGHGMIFRTFEGEYMLTLHSPNKTKSEHPAFYQISYKGEELYANENKTR